MSKKILIIDDEADIVRVLVYRFKSRKYEVFIADDGKKGLKEAQKQKPDLILLDYLLPDMNATELSQKLRQIESMNKIPIILITATTEMIEMKAEECGAVDYLVKPIEMEELYSKIENALQNQ